MLSSIQQLLNAKIKLVEFSIPVPIFGSVRKLRINLTRPASHSDVTADSETGGAVWWSTMPFGAHSKVDSGGRMQCKLEP